MTLVDQMTKLHSRLQSIPIRLGVPQHQKLMIVHGYIDPDTKEKRFTKTWIEPVPYITFASESLQKYILSGSVQVKATDYQVEDVIRSQPESWFRDNVEYFIIDPDTDLTGNCVCADNGVPLGGIQCRLLFLKNDDITTYTLILRSLKDDYERNSY